MAGNSFKIVVLPGDGIGPEVIAQALRVLKFVAASANDVTLTFEEHDFGGIAIDKHGDPLPETTLNACKSADAVLLGSVGGPKWDGGVKRPEQGLLGLRKALGLYANIRPANFASNSLIAASPLKESIASGVDFIIVRELIGGLYFGDRKEQGEEPNIHSAWDTMAYSVEEVQRIVRVAAKIALTANPPLAVHSIDKANVLASSRLWRRVVKETLETEFPTIHFDHSLVDSAAMVMVSNPRKLNGVIVTENMFGDILSDEASVIPGSLGLLPSASLAGAPILPGDAGFKTCLGLYEPIHGSAPDIAGHGIANPVGTILSVAMLLRYSLGMESYAKAIESAVRKVLDSKDEGGFALRTKDLGGVHSTVDVGDKVIEVLKQHQF